MLSSRRTSSSSGWQRPGRRWTYAFRTLDGVPDGGWIPEERTPAEAALKAYAVNNAGAEGREGDKGRLAAGHLADLVVLDAEPLAVAPAALQELRVDLTIVGGRVVPRRGGR